MLVRVTALAGGTAEFWSVYPVRSVQAVRQADGTVFAFISLEPAGYEWTEVHVYALPDYARVKVFPRNSPPQTIIPEMRTHDTCL